VEPIEYQASPSELAHRYLSRWRRRAEGIFLALGVPRDDRDDIAQESYLAFLLRQHAIAKPEAYYLQIVRRRSIDFLRRGRPSKTGRGSGPTPSTESASSPDRVDLERWLQRMQSGERRLVLAYVVEGRSHQELAMDHGIRRESMRKKVLRALNKLRHLARSA